MQIVRKADDLLALMQDGWEVRAVDGVSRETVWAQKGREMRKVHKQALQALIRWKEVSLSYRKWPTSYYSIRR